MTTEIHPALLKAGFTTLLEILRWRAKNQPDQRAYTFLIDGEMKEAHITYGELERQAQAIGASLIKAGASGGRALLLYMPGIDYIAAFFGCIYAGVTAIPVYPPDPNRLDRTLPRLLAIAQDAQPVAAMTTSQILGMAEFLFAEDPNFQSMRWLATDKVDPVMVQEWQEPDLNSQSIAFLQYTSGSTGTPKGVMLTHSNLLYNFSLMEDCFKTGPDSHAVIWLPPYHDMGLIGGILEPFYSGYPVTLMSPMAFLKRPFRWLHAISRQRGTISGGPNFAYELCTRKISPEELKTLDLSCWRVAFNGAEPVRAETMQRFYETFKSCGFREDAFHPCYGLAEATLIVSGGQLASLPVPEIVDGTAIERNRIIFTSSDEPSAKSLIGCGVSLGEQRIAIVDPETFRQSPRDQVGEVWVSGKSISVGYWNKPVETKNILQAYLAETGEGPFLRTGDLGFLKDGELFITGRLKDLIIIRGRNYYPQDIEQIIEQSHPSIKPGGCAAFSINIGGEERLAVVAEMDKKFYEPVGENGNGSGPNYENVTGAIRETVARYHDLQVHSIGLLKAGSIPKTSSGKIQRHACHNGLINGELDIVALNQLADAERARASAPLDTSTGETILTREMLLATEFTEREPLLEHYLCYQTAKIMQLPLDQLNRQQPLNQLGIDSINAVELKNRIETDFGINFPLNSLLAGVTIAQMVAQILEQLQTTEGFQPIIPIERTAIAHPLSYAQQRIWFLDQLEPGNPAYNIPAARRLQGSLNVKALTDSLNEILNRHESLRTTFHSIDGKAVQVIVPKEILAVPIIDLSNLPASRQETEIQRLTRFEANKSFDLAQSPLMRATLLRLSKNDHILLLTMHHIISDGWSMGVLVKEFALLYQAFANNESIALTNKSYALANKSYALANKSYALADLPIQYVDFTYWQRAWLQSELLDADLNYWQSQLEDLKTISLPTDFPRAAVQTNRGGVESITIPQALYQKLKHLSQQQGCTLFMTLLAAFYTLLYRYTGQTDLVVGSPISGRNRAEIAGLIGFFVNTLVLRVKLAGSLSFRQLLELVRDTALEAYAHQDLPFEKLVEVLNPARDMSRTPLYQVLFVLQQAQPTLELSGLMIDEIDTEVGATQLDLALSMVEKDGQLVGIFEYSLDLFEAATIKRMAAHFKRLLTRVVADADECLGDLGMLSELELKQLLIDWNDTEVAYPQEKTIQQLFEEQVERTPEGIALVFEGQEVTYLALNERANQLAHYLRKEGIGVESLVAICLDRSIEMIVSILGVLKAGGAYLPLDKDYPQQRLSFMLNDARPALLLTTQLLMEELSELETRVTRIITLESIAELLSAELTDNLVNLSVIDNLAYVIYTSGSTGRPKGVLVPQRGVCSLAKGQLENFSMSPDKKVIQFTSYNFDVSVLEIFMALLSGARLYLANKLNLMPGPDLVKMLQQAGITTTFLTPSVLSAISGNELAQLQTLACGGEVCPEKIIKEWAVKRNFYNAYGPTETTICSTLALCQADTNNSNIGKPIPNTQVYILDNDLQPVPIGVIGELYIAGAGLSRGYLNNAHLTAEKFVPNPYSNEPGSRMYRTGDLGRFHADGNIEFIGRRDEQVKVRGFRIELGEVEATLAEYPGIQEVIVMVREDRPGNKRLVAYIVHNQQYPISTNDLRAFLKDRLPDYMIPAVFVIMESFPTLPNGKIDRHSLCAPNENRPELDQALVNPQNEIEQMLTNVWTQVLGISEIGIHDNFFELGGDSILSIQIVSRANQAGLKITPKQLFQHQTIAELAKVAQPSQIDEIDQTEQGILTGPVPLTPIQHFFFEQQLPDLNHWNQAIMLEVHGLLDITHFEQAIKQLITHHDALRLRYTEKSSGWLQVYGALDDSMPFTSIDLSNMSDSQQIATIEQEATKLQASLSITKGNLINSIYFDLGSSRPGRLLMVIHHLAVDAVSWRILVEDLERFYDQISRLKTIHLPNKTTSFKQWATSLIEYAQSKTLKKELDYWLSLPWSEAQTLPIDYPLGINSEISARTIKVSLNVRETTALLQQVPEVYHTQINEVLVTALARAFGNWMEEGILQIDLEGHGREDIFENLDLSRTVGWFTTVYPVLVKLNKISDIGNQLKSVKEQMRAIANHGLGYGILRYLSEHKEEIAKLREIGKAAISFNYLGNLDLGRGEDGKKFALARESVGPLHSLKGNRLYLLEMVGSVVAGKLQFEVTYSENIHHKNSIKALADALISALQSIIAHCQSPEAGGFTPSDFPLCHLSQPELDRLVVSKDTAIEDIYPLSLMQQGMFYHGLQSSESGLYIEQFHCTLKGGFDLANFERAWQTVVTRHTALRTAFVWQELKEPRQIVYKKVQLAIDKLDWTLLSETEQKAALATYLDRIRTTGFNLAQAPLMRLTLIQLADQHYQFIWSFHHILFDGWCLSLVMKEVFSFYESYTQGHELVMEMPHAYRDYIAWLYQQDLEKARTFWQETLAGFTAPTPIVAETIDEEANGYGEQLFKLSAAATTALQDLAKRYQLTLSTLVQGVWSALLSRYSGERDVVLGVTVAGRPWELAGIESMVGLFINTLPIRVKLYDEKPVNIWLKDIQSYNLELQQYEFTTGGQVQLWSEMPGALPLYESILVFENYPLEMSLTQSLSIDISETGFKGAQTKYGLTLLIFPGLEMTFQLRYNNRRHNDGTMMLVLRHLEKLLLSIAADPEQSLATLYKAIPQDEIPTVKILGKNDLQKEEFVAPTSKIEKALSRLWAELFGLEQIGIHDNFFKLGGHSLIAVQMVSRLREAFQIELPMRSLFESPTIARLAVAITELKANKTQQNDALALPNVYFPQLAQRYQPFPLTDVQRAYWLGRMSDFELGNVSTHGYLEIDFDDLDLNRFELALQRLIARHEMLRAIVRPDGQQQILPEVPLYRIKVSDLRGLDEERATTEKMAIRSRMSHQVLPADQWPLFEICASIFDDEFDNQKIRLHISTDALIVDAWSMRMLIIEIDRFYQDPEILMSPLELSFRDYLLAEQALRNTELYQRAQDYWIKRIPSLPPAPDLPLAINPATLKKPKFGRWTAKLPAETWARLKLRATQQGLTPSTLLLSAFAEVLTYWSKSPKFTINLTFFHRLPMHPQVNDICGDFTSLTLLAVDNSGHNSFESRAQRLQQQLWDDLDHRYFSGIEVMRKLSADQGLVSGALMPVVFTSTLTLNNPGEDLTALSLQGSLNYSISQTPQVWIDHQVYENGGMLIFNWDAVLDIFPSGMLDDMFGCYCRLLEKLAQEDQIWQQNCLPLLPQAQLEQRLAVNKTAGPITKNLLHTLFADQVERHVDDLAVISSDQTLTYKELYSRANRLGNELLHLGASKNRLIAVVMEKGWQQVVSVLGILNAGAAYLPISPTMPRERLWYLLEHGQVEIVLTQPHLKTELSWPENLLKIVVSEEVNREFDDQPITPVQQPDDIAYVIYTSGSTGLPKGVVIDHQGAVNTILDLNERFSLTPKDRILALSSLSFDLSVYDIFGMLAAGGTVVMPDPEAGQDAAHWADMIENNGVTIWNSVPALMEMFVAYLELECQPWPNQLRLVMMSGDWIPITLPDRIRALSPDVELISMGGATEASIWSIIYAIKEISPDWKSVPYGKPMVNQQFHVLNEALMPCPVWVPGQLFIGGIGLAKGYWCDPQKSADSFITHPVTNERLYRTGDLGRYLPDGNIEFLGRVDFQVKIRGYRIELGEIEAALHKHPNVPECLVIVREDNPGDKRLVAYIITEQPELITASELRAFLKERLPEYMLPTAFITITTLPLSSNGKVDRRRLPAPEQADNLTLAEYVAATNSIEAEMAQIWTQVLNIELVSIQDNFFELGGHSLLATQIISQVREHFKIELPLRSLFECPTVQSLAAKVMKLKQETLSTPRLPLVPVSREAALPLSFAQQRLWFLDRLEPNSALYNGPFAIRLKGRVDVAALLASFNAVVDRHEILRTSFSIKDGQAVQIIHPLLKLEMPIIDLQSLPSAEREAQATRLINEEIQNPFDLNQLPMLRLMLLRMAESDHIMMLNWHHIVSDGWSVGILIREIMAFYAEYSQQEAALLLPLPIQYADFSVWQREWLQGDVMETLISYWKKKLAGILPVLKLPTDFPRPDIQTYNGTISTSTVSKSLTQDLKCLSNQEGVSLYMTLLGAFQTLLHRYSKQDDIIVGTDIANRNRAELEKLIGFFVNQLVLRTDLSGNPTFRELLGRVRDITLEAYAHQDLPFDKLIEIINPARSTSYSPIFQVKLVLQNTPLPALEVAGLLLEAIELPTKNSRFDLCVIITETEEGMAEIWNYNTDLFEARTIEKMQNHFHTLLANIVSDPDQHIADLKLLSEDETAGVTPAHFTNIALSQKDLENLILEMDEEY